MSLTTAMYTSVSVKVKPGFVLFRFWQKTLIDKLSAGEIIYR